RGIGQLLDLTAINRLDNRIAGREVAVKRANPDASATRDLVETRLRPDFRERRLGRFEQAVAVPLRVGPGLASGGLRCSNGRAARPAGHLGAQFFCLPLSSGGTLRISTGGILRLF